MVLVERDVAFLRALEVRGDALARRSARAPARARPSRAPGPGAADRCRGPRGRSAARAGCTAAIASQHWRIRGSRSPTIARHRLELAPRPRASTIHWPGGAQSAATERRVVGVRLAERHRHDADHQLEEPRRARRAGSSRREAPTPGADRRRRRGPGRGQRDDVVGAHGSDHGRHRGSMARWTAGSRRTTRRRCARAALRPAHRRLGADRPAPPGAAEPSRDRLPVLRRRPRSARAVRRARVREPLAAAACPARRSTRPRGTTGARRVPARGAAEVVLFSPDHDASLATIGVDGVLRVVDLWIERTEALLARPEIEYVLVFENRGAAVGATIHHPHGQIYGYPFVPPTPAREIAAAAGRGCAGVRGGRVGDGRRATGSCSTTASGSRGCRSRRRTRTGCGSRRARTSAGSPTSTPTVAARSPARSPTCSAATTGCGRARVDDGPFPYLLWFHQAPAHHDGEYHLHAHIAPPLRAPGVLRYVASGELGGGLLANPVLPEQAAAELRARRAASSNAARDRSRSAVRADPRRARRRARGLRPRARAREPARRPRRLPRRAASPRWRSTATSSSVCARRTDGRVTVRSLDLAGTVDVAADGTTEPRGVEPVVGPLGRGRRRHARARRAPGRRDRRRGRRPTSRSARACRRARRSRSRSRSRSATAADWSTDVRSLALACQQAEHDATGVPCGIQDQLVALAGVADHALVIDCRDLAIEALPLPAGRRRARRALGCSAHARRQPMGARGAPSPRRRRRGSVCACCATHGRPTSPTIPRRGTSSPR